MFRRLRACQHLRPRRGPHCQPVRGPGSEPLGHTLGDGARREGEGAVADAAGVLGDAPGAEGRRLPAAEAGEVDEGLGVVRKARVGE